MVRALAFFLCSHTAAYSWSHVVVVVSVTYIFPNESSTFFYLFNLYLLFVSLPPPWLESFLFYPIHVNASLCSLLTHFPSSIFLSSSTDPYAHPPLGALLRTVLVFVYRLSRQNDALQEVFPRRGSSCGDVAFL